MAQSYRIKIANNVTNRLIAQGISEDTACLIFDRLVDGMEHDPDLLLKDIYNELSECPYKGE